MNQLDIDYALTVATETDNEYQEETYDQIFVFGHKSCLLFLQEHECF